MFSEHVQTRAARRESTRQNVLASAEQLFRSQGFGTTTVRQIAADADVSTGTVMAVGDKAALLVAIFDGWIDAVHQARKREHDTGRSPVPSTDPVADVMALFEPFIAHFALNRDLSREYAAIIVRGDHESAIFYELALALVSELRQVLSQAGLSADDAGPAASSVYFSYIGLLMTVANGAIGENAAPEHLRDVIAFVLNHKGNQ